MARAQLYERLIQSLANFQPVLDQSGKIVDIPEAMVLIADALASDRAGRIIRDKTPEEIANYQMAMMAQAQANQATQPNPNQQPNRQPTPEETASMEQQPTRPGADGGGPLGMHGGPMGPAQTDQNIEAQMAQLQGQMNQGGMPQ